MKRRYVIPGDKIVEGNFRPLMNVIKAGNALIATRIGIAETGRDGVKVIPLSGVYIPRVNDLVIGKIVDHSSLSWEVDINSCFSAHLPAQDVFGRDFSPARDDMTRHFAVGDMITARIMAFDRTRDPMLTVQDRDLGKIARGEALKISAVNRQARLYDPDDRTGYPDSRADRTERDRGRDGQDSRRNKTGSQGDQDGRRRSAHGKPYAAHQSTLERAGHSATAGNIARSGWRHS